MKTTQNMKSLASITRLMNFTEQEIARMTARIQKFGEAKVGAQYMAEYENKLEMWDQMKVERDQIMKNTIASVL